MENVKPSALNPGVKWAVIYLLVSVVLTFLLQYLNVALNSPLSYLTYVALIAFLLLAQKEYKGQLGGYLSFGEAFMPGLWYSLFSGLFSAIFMYIYITMLNPAFMDKIVAKTQADMEAKNAPSDQITMATDMMRNHGGLFIAFGALFMIALIGIIAALIGAAIFKKERSILDIENDASNYSDPAV